MLQLCINWECVGGLRLTLPGVLQLEQPWELYCHIRGYSYNPRGAQTLAHPALQSLMNYATEAVFILLSVPLAWISVSYLFWQEGGGCVQLWLCVPVKMCASSSLVWQEEEGCTRLCEWAWDRDGTLKMMGRGFCAPPLAHFKLEPWSWSPLHRAYKIDPPRTHHHHSDILSFFSPL